MELCLIALAILTALTALCLLCKVLLMRKAAREITQELEDRLTGESNTLIGISSRDGAMRLLAGSLNTQLRRLRAERQRFKQGDREVKEAITAVAHDLRTPLTAIGGYLSLLKREALSPDARRYVAAIEGRVEAMEQLAQELFRYSVVTTARELKPERVDLRRALEESLVSFYAAISERGIEPEIALPARAVERMLDAEALSRVLSNILNNAVKYSDGDLRVSLDGDGTMLFCNRAAQLSGVDVGRLFDRFYTVETGRGATGLGLSIARQLTERMGGAIRADYADGALRIEVCFPEQREEEPGM